MAIKTFINGQENGAITFYGDTEPCSVYVNGEKQENISYVPQSIEGVNSVQYSSKYKKNIRTMQIDGNTTQYQGEAIATKAIAIPTFESEMLTGSYPSETPLEISFDAPYTITLSNFNGIEINGAIDNSIEVVLATSKEDIYNINTTTNPVYRLYSNGVNTPHEVTSATTLYIGLAVESGSVLTDNLASAWEQLQSATLTASKTVNAPSLDAPQPIQNAGDNGMDLTLRGTNLLDLEAFATTSGSCVVDGDTLTLTKLTASDRISNSVSLSQYPAGTKLTFSMDRIIENTSNSAYFYLWFVKKNGTNVYGDSLVNNYRQSLTVTVPSSGYASVKVFLQAGSSNGAYLKVKGFRMSVGETVYPYEPYFEPTIIKTNSVSYLPTEYQRVEYIESTGTQIIDTGFYPTSNTKVELDLRFTNVSDEASANAFLGVYDNPNVFTVNFGSSASQKTIIFAWVNKTYADGGIAGSTNYGSSIIENRNTFVLTNESVSYGTMFKALSKGDWSVLNNSLRLFGTYNSAENSPFNRYHMVLYGGKIYDNDTLVRDFIPCYRKSDNVIGLYDAVNNVFYTNDGTGEFVKGLDMPLLKFAKVGDIADSLTVDRVQGKVTYTERILKKVFTGNENIVLNTNTNGFIIWSNPDIPTGYNQGFCNYLPVYFANASGQQGYRLWIGAGNNSIYFVGLQKIFGNQNSTFKTYLKDLYNAGTPWIFECERAEYVTYDLTDTELGQNLLALATQNQTNIIEITSSPSVSYLSVNYAKWGNI